MFHTRNVEDKLPNHELLVITISFRFVFVPIQCRLQCAAGHVVVLCHWPTSHLPEILPRGYWWPCDVLRKHAALWVPREEIHRIHIKRPMTCNRPSSPETQSSSLPATWHDDCSTLLQFVLNFSFLLLCEVKLREIEAVFQHNAGRILGRV